MKLSFYTIKQYENLGYTVPDYVKTASVEDLSSDNLDSRANIWMHALNHYTAENEQGKTAMDLIEKRANYFGNRDDVIQIKNVFSKLASDSVSDYDYAIVGNGIREYPVRNRKEWSAANKFLHKNANALPKCFKTKMAAKLLQKAADYNISVNDEDTLLKFAGIGLPLDDSVIAQLYRRSEKYAEPELGKLASAIDKYPESLNNQKFCDDLVDFLQETDNKYAEFFHNLYDGNILPPDDAVYTVSLKQAADLVNDLVKVKTGKVYSKDQLRLVKLADVKELFGDDVASEVNSGISVDTDKLAAVLEELPLPEASVFDEYMNSKSNEDIDG